MTTRLCLSQLLVVWVAVGLCQSCRSPVSQATPAVTREAQASEKSLPPELPPESPPEPPLELSPDEANDRLDACIPPLKEETNGGNQPYTVINEQESPQYDIFGNTVFQSATLPYQSIAFDEQAMLNVVTSTRAYFTEHGCQDLKILRSGLLGTRKVQMSDVLETLDFMADVLQADLDAGQPTRLKDPAFINQNFDVIRWMAFDPDFPSEERLRITKYAVFTHPGSRQRTEIFNTPVYQLKADLDDESFITQYTKQEVLGGIYEPGGAEFGKVETLAYLSRASFEDALMQGTAFITFPDGSSTYFNVDKNNGIAFVHGVDPWQQGRYWYFKEVDNLNGYGHNVAAKIPIEPGVTFAGDVLNIGLGKIVAIEAGDQSLRFGVIADTGGAFLPNLRQLDFFAGVFPNWEAYQQSISGLPEYTQAYLLLKKQSAIAGN